MRKTDRKSITLDTHLSMVRGDDMPVEQDTPRHILPKKEIKESHVHEAIRKFEKEGTWRFLDATDSIIQQSEDAGENVTRYENRSTNKLMNLESLMPVSLLLLSMSLVLSYLLPSSVSFYLALISLLLVLPSMYGKMNTKSTPQRGLEQYKLKLETAILAEPDEIIEYILDNNKYNHKVLVDLGISRNQIQTNVNLNLVYVQDGANKYVLEYSCLLDDQDHQTLYAISSLGSYAPGANGYGVPKSRLVMYTSGNSAYTTEYIQKLLCKKLNYLKCSITLQPVKILNEAPMSSSVSLSSLKRSKEEQKSGRVSYGLSTQDYSLAKDLNIDDESDVEYEVYEYEELKKKQTQQYEASVAPIEKLQIQDPEDLKYTQMATEGVKRLISLIDDTNWTEITKDGDFVLYETEAEGDTECLMSVGYFDFPVKAVADYLTRDQVQKQFDTNFMEDELIKQYSNNTKVVWSKFKGVWPVQGRDFCMLYKFYDEFEDGGFAISCFSTEHDECPPSAKFTRARVITGGWLVRPSKDDPDKSYAYSISHFDPMGNIPKSLVNYLTKSKGSYVKQVAAAMKKYY